MYLFLLNELQCPTCGMIRFKDNSEKRAMDKRMKNFFFCANLEDVQNSFYQGKIRSAS